MCGLIGYSGSVPADSLALKLLFAYNESRGNDSAGYYSYNKNDSTHALEVVKEVGKVTEKLLPSCHFGNPTLLIGHTRKATYGIINKENAHPFIIVDDKKRSPVIGAHNGRVDNAFDLSKKYNALGYKVDSELIFKIIQKTGEATILCEISKLEHAVLYSTHDGILRVFKLADRPLFRGLYEYDDGNIGMYISSLKESLEAIECTKIEEFKNSTLYKIENGKIINTRVLARQPYEEPRHTSHSDRTYRGGSSTTVYGDSYEEIQFTRLSLLGDDMSMKSLTEKLLNNGGNDLNLSSEVLLLEKDTEIDELAPDPVETADDNIKTFSTIEDTYSQSLSSLIGPNLRPDVLSSLVKNGNPGVLEEHDVITSSEDDDSTVEDLTKTQKKILLEHIMKMLEDCLTNLTSVKNSLNQLNKDISFPANIDKEIRVSASIDDMRTNVINTMKHIDELKDKISALLN